MSRDLNSIVNRRRAISVGAGSLAGLACSEMLGSDIQQRLGLVVYCCSRRRKWMQSQGQDGDLFAPLRFLEHCRSVRAGGGQASLGVLSATESRRIREFVESNEMFLEAILRLPGSDRDLERFEAEVKSAAECGVTVARTTMIPGRRYERFQSLKDFKQAEAAGVRMLQRATPIVAKHRLALAIENHKDQRLDERVALLRSIGSEYVGACLDTGNSLALLDGPYETISRLAPFAHSVHLKDQSLMAYDEGFLLGDVPLGQGSLDMPKIVQMIRDSRPNIQFSLELITRDPLRVPCLTEKYYATMPDLPASSLANALAFVRQHSKPGQQVASLSLSRQVELEDRNVRDSLNYASRHLKL